MIGYARSVGSPALLALVLGHIAAGRPELARLACSLPALHLAVLDAWLEEAMERAALAGAAAAVEV